MEFDESTELMEETSEAKRGWERIGQNEKCDRLGVGKCARVGRSRKLRKWGRNNRIRAVGFN